MNNIIATENTNINEPPKNVFGVVPARSSGIWSFFMQLLIIIISSVVIIFFYIFINGEPTALNGSQKSDGKPWNFNVINEVEQIFNKSNNSTSDPFFHHKMLNNDTTEVLNELSDAVINIGELFRIEILRLVVYSAFTNISINALWFLSAIFLLASVKFEIKDFVIINGEFLMFSCLGHLCHAVIVGSLLFYMKKSHWQMILIISFTSGILILTIIANFIILYFNWIWCRYISYMNGDDNCICFAKIAKICKCRRSGNANVTSGEYVLPVATISSNLPYIDEQSIRNFSNF